MNSRELGYELTLKEIDNEAVYEPLELCGLSGLGIDRMKSLLDNGILPSDDARHVKGRDFLNWVDQNDLPVKKQ
ncbi:hypothetical protein EV586_104171 [Tumebacillus sp. BK434]|uniref:hypothetical protein n=1 Tax=Tumebacillus sp. BK434 TaxID=2512169 RepID=UPI00104C1723|nr:hypothetical protein [Tumebacillus sp. BK434]TCP54552.1 hypothetical protein EV586_104171 [Tumebacillus sp. BK434]